MDKTVEIQERIERYLVLYRSGEYNKRQIAEKILKLFKVKLPENPYTSNITEYPDKIYNPNACVWFNEALQQVKEALEKAGVEVGE